MKLRLSALGAAMTVALAWPAQADQSDSARFDLTLRGIRAGTLNFEGTEAGGRYGVTGKLESGGLVAVMRTIRYDATAEGAVNGSRFTPSRYTEASDTGKRQSESAMDYVGGVPQVKVYNPPKKPRPGDVDPATQGGTVDPLTALYATLRDQPAGALCNSTLTLFDGRHRSQIALAAPEPGDNGSVSCAGEYRRLAGFSEKEMAEKVRFPFRIRYVPGTNGMMQAQSVSMDTLYGKGELKRR